MRFLLLGIILLSGTASVPAFAQREGIDRRVDRLEQEMRAVQRRVFPGGAAGPVIEPEIQPQAPTLGGPAASGNALSSLTNRVDALERQLASLTGQAEESAYRLGQMEEALSRLQRDTEQRLAAVERSASAPAPISAPSVSSPTQAPATPAGPAPAPAASTGDPAQDAYNAGYRLWDQRRYAEAQAALEAAAAAHPNSRWASWSRNLAGRAYLDDGKPATAARILLSNYQDLPRGERAADSLFFLGQALTQLDRRTEACRVYDELVEVYPNMRDWLRQRLPQARTAARCS